MEKTVLAAQNAKARPRTHNAFTIKASETEIEGGASTVEARDAVVFPLLFRRSIEEDLRKLNFWIELKVEVEPRLLMGSAQSHNASDIGLQGGKVGGFPLGASPCTSKGFFSTSKNFFNSCFALYSKR